MRWPGQLKKEHLLEPTLHAHRDDLLRSLNLRADPVIAEVGVGLGDFSAIMLDHFKPAQFHAYDHFQMHHWPAVWGRPTQEVFAEDTHYEFYKKRFASDGRVILHEGDSSSELGKAPNQIFDLIYLDGDHRYEGVKKDADAAVQKLAPGGVLIFNDYMMYDFIAKVEYGVVQVVNSLCLNEGWKVIAFALQGSMFCDIALKHQ